MLNPWIPPSPSMQASQLTEKWVYGHNQFAFPILLSSGQLPNWHLCFPKAHQVPDYRALCSRAQAKRHQQAAATISCECPRRQLLRPSSQFPFKLSPKSVKCWRSQFVLVAFALTNHSKIVIDIKALSSILQEYKAVQNLKLYFKLYFMLKSVWDS